MTIDIADQPAYDNEIDDFKRRVWHAVIEVNRLRIPTAVLTVFVAGDIFRTVCRTSTVVDVFGMPIKVDRSLNDGGIRLRCEVSA